MALYPCFICGTADDTVHYCGLCRKWLCAHCRADPVARARAFARQLIKKS